MSAIKVLVQTKVQSKNFALPLQSQRAPLPVTCSTGITSLTGGASWFTIRLNLTDLAEPVYVEN